MSIYGTIFDLEDNPPYAYLGSHVLPHETDGRDSTCTVQLAEIPSHITRDGRDDQPEDGVPWPWLRLSLGQEDTVLDRDQVAAMHEAMGVWLEQTAPPVRAAGQRTDPCHDTDPHDPHSWDETQDSSKWCDGVLAGEAW